MVGYRRATPASPISLPPIASYHVEPDLIIFARFRFAMYLRHWEVIIDIENGGGLCLRIRSDRGRMTEFVWINANGILRRYPIRTYSTPPFRYTFVLHFQNQIY